MKNQGTDDYLLTILARADDTEQIVYVDFNLEKSGKVREKRPYAQLRRKEFYV